MPDEKSVVNNTAKKGVLLTGAQPWGGDMVLISLLTPMVLLQLPPLCKYFSTDGLDSSESYLNHLHAQPSLAFGSAPAPRSPINGFGSAQEDSAEDGADLEDMDTEWSKNFDFWTVKFQELTSSHLEAEIDGHTRKRKRGADSAQTQEDLDSVSDDGWLDEEEDPGIEHDPLYQGSDSQTFIGSQDAHLDSPCLLNLLSDRLVEGSHTAPPQNESDTLTLPLGGPVQWAFTLL
ncbi:hypothetical protein C8R48DRAFT_677238 [Suillus tomentosus]|nr:hypothetical protein C8R48DRAFT_677238 [Suillus tomentosus]